MQNKNINIVAGVAVVLAVIFGVSYLKPTAVNNVVNVPEPRQVESPSFGATPGPDRYFPCETINGVQSCFNSSGLYTATSTFCSIKSPMATSSLRFGSVNFITSSTSPMIVDLGRGTAPNSTTTERIGSAYKIGTSTPVTIFASSTPFSSVFPAGQWFVVKGSIDVVASTINGVNGTFSPTGSCKAEFTVN